VTTPLYGYGEDNYQSLGWTSGCESVPVARINDDGEDPVWSLGDLPEEKIKEFAQSEYFSIYKEVFEKLNLT